MKPGNLRHKELYHVTKSDSIHGVSMSHDQAMRTEYPAHSLRRRLISAIDGTAKRGL